MDGIINVYKEAGYTSHDVVAKLRGILHQKKIGHTGTLDPEATGVLPVCCGKATKVCDLLTTKDKSYRAVCRLGVETDTQDMTGQILTRGDISMITQEQLRECILCFVGDIMQTPPMYSALKVNGKKLYELAREGKTVERMPRPVHIYSIDIQEIDLEQGLFTMDVTCSKGTYIRTLCHDIGQQLGCGGAMESLVRTRVSVFDIEDALKLEDIAALVQQEPEQLTPHVYTVDSLFPQYPKLHILEEYASKLTNGNPLLVHFLASTPEQSQKNAELTGGHPQPGLWESGRKILVYDEQGRFKAIYSKEDRDIRVYKMF